MAKKCDICDKAPVTGNNVSHSKRRTKRRWKPNLQLIKLTLNGVQKKVRLCTGCLKTQSKKLTAA